MSARLLVEGRRAGFGAEAAAHHEAACGLLDGEQVDELLVVELEVAHRDDDVCF